MGGDHDGATPLLADWPADEPAQSPARYGQPLSKAAVAQLRGQRVPALRTVSSADATADAVAHARQVTFHHGRVTLASVALDVAKLALHEAEARARSAELVRALPCDAIAAAVRDKVAQGVTHFKVVVPADTTAWTALFREPRRTPFDAAYVRALLRQRFGDGVEIVQIAPTWSWRPWRPWPAWRGRVAAITFHVEGVVLTE
jgi:hypothetical protein